MRFWKRNRNLINQEAKKEPFYWRAIVLFLGCLMVAAVMAFYAYGFWLLIPAIWSLPTRWAGFAAALAQNLNELVGFLRRQEKEIIALWITGFLFNTWLLASPLVCLYWLFKPAEWFWWKHKHISRAIFYGGFFGCIAIITTGVHLFLWFIPDSWLLEKGVPFTSWLIASPIGLIVTFTLWCKLEELFEQKRQKDMSDRIKWEHWKLRCLLDKDDAATPGLIKEMRELEQLQKEKKLDPFWEAKLIALKHVCDQYEDPNLGRTTYDNLADPTPNAYGYDGIDGPIDAVESIAEDVFNDSAQSQEKEAAKMSRAQKDCIKDFLKSLTRPERVIVVLYYYEEMTIAEIAKVLELSPSEVSETHSSIIARCKAYLREQDSLGTRNSLFVCGVGL